MYLFFEDIEVNVNEPLIIFFLIIETFDRGGVDINKKKGVDLL